MRRVERSGYCKALLDSGGMTKQGVVGPDTLRVSSRRPLSQCPVNRHTTTTTSTNRRDHEPAGLTTRIR